MISTNISIDMCCYADGINTIVWAKNVDDIQGVTFIKIITIDCQAINWFGIRIKLQRLSSEQNKIN